MRLFHPLELGWSEQEERDWTRQWNRCVRLPNHLIQSTTLAIRSVASAILIQSCHQWLKSAAGSSTDVCRIRQRRRLRCKIPELLWWFVRSAAAIDLQYLTLHAIAAPSTPSIRTACASVAHTFMGRQAPTPSCLQRTSKQFEASLTIISITC